MHFSFHHDIELQNSRALLRPLSITDMSLLAPIALNNPNLLQYSPKQVHTPQLLAAYIENAIIERHNNTRYTFIIFDKQHNSYAGTTAFMNISCADEKLEIGATWLGNTFHGTGLNTACKHLLLHYAFETAGAFRVEFRVDERNIPSRKAVEKLGASFEGILRNHIMLPAGFRRSSCYYSILKPEWKSTSSNTKHIIK